MVPPTTTYRYHKPSAAPVLYSPVATTHSLPTSTASPRTHHSTPRSSAPLIPSSHALRTATLPLPPATPLPTHPNAEAQPTVLSTAATAFALQSYFFTFLLTLGWDPLQTPAPQFITTYAWLLGRELSLPPATAQKLFLEIWDSCTPTIGLVATAIQGMDESLGCSAETKRGVERLFKRTQGTGTKDALKWWGEERLSVKVGGEIVGRKRRGGWGDVFREVRGKLKCWSKDDGADTDAETVLGRAKT